MLRCSCRHTVVAPAGAACKGIKLVTTNTASAKQKAGARITPQKDLQYIMLSSILDSDSSYDLLATKLDEGISMDSKRPPTNRAAEPQRIDDLKLINGIGPAVEKRLNDVGIVAFAQLAALSPADIAAVVADLAGLSAERIIKQDWLGQARELAAESTSNEAQKQLETATESSVAIEYARAATPLIEPQKTGDLRPESISSELQEEIETPVDTKQVAAFTAPVQPMPPIKDAHIVTPLEEPQKGTETMATKEQLHPATFTVELLLDENNYVHSARVMHVESQREHSWSGWPNTELVDFLIESVELKIPTDEPALPNAEAHVHPEEPVHASVADAEIKPLIIPEAEPMLTGQLHVREMEIVGVAPIKQLKTLARDTPFDVRLILDLSELQGPRNTPLNYTASIYGKSSRTGLVLGQIQGTIIPTDTVTINVEGNMLSEEGIYQLAAQVIVGLPNTKLRVRPGTTTLIDGGQVQVY
jgi:predicted flap endonuclease-1-like 5' DNA nuclease